jgi:hypothetical protein
VKVLTVIASRPEQIASFYNDLGVEIVNRMKEREENVRLDVIDCLAASVKTTRLSQDVNALKGLNDLLPIMIPICLKHLSAKEDKTKVAVFNLLQLLVEMVPEGVSNHSNKLFPQISSNLTLKSASHALKLDAMSFLHACLIQCSPQAVRDDLVKLIPTVLTVVGEDWYKLISQG